MALHNPLYKIKARNVKIDQCGASTYNSVQDWFDATQSSGKISGGTFTANHNGTLTVGAGTGIIRAIATTATEPACFFDWAADTLTLTDESTNYIYVDWNSGTPILGSTVTKANANNRDIILLGKVYREGELLHTVEAGMYIAELAKNVLGYLTQLHGEVARTNGFVIGEVSERYLSSTAGVLWAGLTRITTDAHSTAESHIITGGGTGGTIFANNTIVLDSGVGDITGDLEDHEKIMIANSSNGNDGTYTIHSSSFDGTNTTIEIDETTLTTGADTGSVYDSPFESYYYDGDLGTPAWVEGHAYQIDNINYNDVATGLTALTPNRYGVHWVYGDADGHLMVVYGQGDYTLSQATSANPPSSLPNHVSEFGFLAAKIIIKKSATAFTALLSAYETSFTPSGAAVHSELSNLLWSVAGHTGTVSTFAGFDGTGAATNYTEANYLLTDGTRALAGAWDMGSQILTNVNIDSGDINVAVTNTEWDAAYSHISADGSSHSFIDQSVVSGASPTFDGTNFTGIDISSGTNLAVTSPIVLTGDTLSLDESAVDHNSTNNLAVGDVHTQYALLAGRSGGQSIYGGTGASETLILEGSSHSTFGSVISQVYTSETSTIQTALKLRHRTTGSMDNSFGVGIDFQVDQDTFVTRADNTVAAIQCQADGDSLTGTLLFKTWNFGGLALTTRLEIDNAGDVGISGSLTVDGNINVNGGSITNSDGDDFWELNEESYISENLVVGNNAAGPVTTNSKVECQGAIDPTLSLHNTTAEDADGGRESSIVWSGKQSGAEITTLAKIQASHDGAADDQKGKLIFYTNDGSDGTSPTEAIRIDSAQDVYMQGDLDLDGGGDIILENSSYIKFENAADDDYGSIRCFSNDAMQFRASKDTGLLHLFEQADGTNILEIFPGKVTIGDTTGTAPTNANLWVLKSGSQVATAARATIVAQNNSSSTGNCEVDIISGTAGDSWLGMGDSANEIAGAVRYDNNVDAISFYTGGSQRWGIVATGTMIPYTDNGYDIGSAAKTPRTMYAHTFNDQTCADFSDYTSEELYNVFKAFKPREDGIIHHSPDTNKYFKHIDMSTVPDEFATRTDEDITRHNMYKLKDTKLVKKSYEKADVIDNQEIEYKSGDKTGIDLGQVVYAQKDFLVKMYEELIQAKEDIILLQEKIQQLKGVA